MANDSVCALFNKSLDKGPVPTDWSKSNVTPVFKNKVDEHDVTNYRTIALLPIISKVLERLVHRFLYSHLSDQLINVQHGFLQGRSICTNS